MRCLEMLGRAVAAMVACAILAGAPVAGAADAAGAAPPQSPPPDSAAGSPQAPPEYRIGPGDTLQIFVWNHPELTVTIPVRPDGQISTPLVENTLAAGRTASQLARELEAKLAEYVRSPTVNVIVTNPVSTLSQVKVIGQVSKAQALAYREGLTVMDVVLAAGGLTEFAAGNRAKIVRQQGGKQQEIPVRLGDLVNKGDMRQNLLLQPGDVLVVPQSRF